ncbi:MAG: hypothetical protein U9R75_09605, partial [Candidatus Thermoplasmatota archaeon]|nr:hypothetical protein [Candidatus Thermoplasmatota archaeon]
SVASAARNTSPGRAGRPSSVTTVATSWNGEGMEGPVRSFLRRRRQQEREDPPRPIIRRPPPPPPYVDPLSDEALDEAERKWLKKIVEGARKAALERTWSKRYKESVTK